jgi:hypothetical protein
LTIGGQLGRARIDTRAAAEGFNIVHLSHPHPRAKRDESDKDPPGHLCIVESGSFTRRRRKSASEGFATREKIVSDT